MSSKDYIVRKHSGYAKRNRMSRRHFNQPKHRSSNTKTDEMRVLHHSFI